MEGADDLLADDKILGTLNNHPVATADMGMNTGMDPWGFQDDSVAGPAAAGIGETLATADPGSLFSFNDPPDNLFS